MDYFVHPQSVVRKIWGKSDTILFIFAGSAAEFALNKAVDWLYFTGRLPADPIGRLFSTVQYARNIVFAAEDDALKTIDRISSIHGAVEKERAAKIPDWAYRDVLYMLIHYSIAAFELLERKLSAAEKQEVYDVFYRMGTRMKIPQLPPTYNSWLPERERHLQQDLALSRHSLDLYKQYKKHLGAVRFAILKQSQLLVVPPLVSNLLQLGKRSVLAPAVPLYKFSRRLKLDFIVKEVLLPAKYKKQIKKLDVVPG